MPEMENILIFLSEKMYLGVAAAVGLILAVVLALAFSGETTDAGPSKIAISIVIDPKDAVVTVDGRLVGSVPVILNVFPDDKLHTIKAKSSGFEPLERDVTFDEPKTVT